MTATLRRRNSRELRLAESQWWALLEAAHALALSVESLPRSQPVRVPAHVFDRAKKLLAMVRAVTA